MPATSHQTIRLDQGSHASPDDGACVMELASMLAGERFSDHPRSVCPVVAIVLRAYNDAVDDERRQSLYSYAAAAVGTRARRSVTKGRLRRCEAFFGDRVATYNPFFHGRLRAVGLAASAYGRGADDIRHRAFLRLVDELVAMEPMPLPQPARAPESAAALRQA
jgi:hypothetical protein